MSIIPNNNDVICGKNREALQAEGSRRFRDIIDTHVKSYVQAKTKFEKMVMTKAIYEQVSQESRFLRFNDTESVWEEISSMAARDKVGHALRFASRAKRRSNKKTHKRSGSSSSSSSEESGSSPFAWDSLVGHLHNGMSNSVSTSLISSSMADLQRSSSFVTCSNPLFKFIENEVRIGSNNNNNQTIVDDLDILLQQVDAAEEDPLDNFMKDILDVVQTIETEEDSVLSLLSEPVGEWDEDRSIHIS